MVDLPAITGKVPPIPRRYFPKMTMPTQPDVKARIAPSGLLFLAVTSVTWGLNWPVTKHLLTEWPPLSARGLAGVVGALMLALLAMVRGQSLRMPAGEWPRLLSGLPQRDLWMSLMGLALLWLPASEAALMAYTMPVWTSLLAWPILGERRR